MAPAAMTLDEAIAFFRTGLPAALAAGAAEGVKEGARAIREEAQREIGHYQREDLPSEDAEWPELARRTKRERVAEGYSENDPGLRSGKGQRSYKDEATGLWGKVSTSDPNMVALEIGTHPDGMQAQPPRPVLLIAAFRKGQVFVDSVAEHAMRAVKEALRNG